jgi:hypothetical protein
MHLGQGHVALSPGATVTAVLLGQLGLVGVELQVGL